MELDWSSVSTLVLEVLCCLVYAWRYQVCWRFYIEDMGFASTMVWYQTHTNTQIYIHITQRDQIQVHIEIYINAICYVLKGTIFIIPNE